MPRIFVIEITGEKLLPIIDYESEVIPRIGESWTWGMQYRVKDVHWLHWGKVAEQRQVKIYVEKV